MKINRVGVCSSTLVHSIFEKIRVEKSPLCKYIIRIFPLQKVFYPNIDEFVENFVLFIDEHFLVYFHKKRDLNALASDTIKERSQEKKDTEIESESKRLCLRNGESDEANAPIGFIGENKDNLADDSYNKVDAAFNLNNDEIAANVISEESLSNIPGKLPPHITETSEPGTEVMREAITYSSSESALPTKASIDSPASATSSFVPPLKYNIAFERRCNEVLKKETVTNLIKENMSKLRAFYDYTSEQVTNLLRARDNSLAQLPAIRSTTIWYNYPRLPTYNEKCTDR